MAGTYFGNTATVPVLVLNCKFMTVLSKFMTVLSIFMTVHKTDNVYNAAKSG